MPLPVTGVVPNSASSSGSGSGPNPYISNGTCYASSDQTLSSGFLPCGNDATGHKACCWAGDNCLDNSACFGIHNGGYVTYVAGCSDPDYLDPSCPDKGRFADDPWTGLVYCNGTSNEWTLCHQPNEPEVLASGAPCFCPTPTASRDVAFHAGPTLGSSASLPSSSGGSMLWFPGHIPTPTFTADSSSGPASSAASSTTSGGRGGSSSSSTPTATASAGNSTSSTTPGITSDDTAGASAGLSTGAKAGIGIAVALAAVVVLAVLATVLLVRRRRRRKRQEEEQEAAANADNNNPTMSPAGKEGFQSPADGAAAGLSPPPPSELDSRAARPWSLRSELPGHSRSIAELSSVGVEGGSPYGGASPLGSQGVSPNTPKERGLETASPGPGGGGGGGDGGEGLGLGLQTVHELPG